MSGKITVLPDEVANHIAAGEVVERPASVVKELMENAIDAEATQIDIEIGVGGKAYIRVRDNGYGMSRADAELAFERHATSKIRCTEDIAHIATLGFRGEALPSIASVSKLTLLTQTPGSFVGTRIEIHGGEILKIMESGSAPGAYIEVNDLFYKTPARLKFLKSAATELSYINNVITDLALAHPHIGFTVKNNAKEQLHLSAENTLLQRIAGLFGRDAIRELVEIHESAGSLEVLGFIGLPSFHKANRNYQKTFVNRRPVKDKVLSHAIQQAYETLIPKRRYPVAFVFLALPVELVDVNVHPTKMEIRFINSQAIHQFVVNAIRKTLSTALNTRSLPALETPDESEQSAFSEPSDAEDAQFEFSPPQRNRFPGEKRVPQGEPCKGAPFLSEFPESTENSGEPSEFRPFPRPHRSTPGPASLPAQEGVISQIQPGSALFSRMRPIGQFQETYILTEQGNDLFIIDQHAAHERIFYEKLQTQLQKNALDIQHLLFPVSIELSHREQAILEEYLPTLQQYGLELEPFGGNTYILKAVPAMLAKADYKKLIYDILDHLTESGKTTGVQEKLDDLLKVMACHTAIRAHHRLQESQIIALLQQLDGLQLPYTCPHGRPMIIKLSLTDLEKKFGRT
ncbi:DNA mismatch repair protein mutL [Candidatus Vecturithrix granuli]|uniref:DNA mismatch repair protein MutL n=1 Tax=Vecturithrix granuli TaxID=1499967 RepID=A0A081C5W9_VECG1|nr:DNA mismatch repair protein mutL [Candidatus Vecturithrix granuli]